MGNIIYKRKQTITGGSSSIAGLTLQGTKSTDFTATANLIYEITASCKMTLPSSPSTNDKIAFFLTSTANFDISSTNKINGSVLATDYVYRVTQLYVIIVLTYSGSTNGWIWESRDNAYLSLTFTGAGDPLLNNVVLFLKGNGANNSTAITDNSSTPKSITRYGDTKISTTQSKYGGSSIYFDGNGDYLDCSFGATSLNIRTGSYCMESWVHPTTSSDFGLFCTETQNFYVDWFGAKWWVGDQSINTINTRPTLSLNIWTHIALSFDGTTYRLFNNGTLISSSTVLLSNYTLSAISIGKRGTRLFTGYLDSIRITIGVPRYTTNFNSETDTYLMT
jgi:hypothetical protein